MVFWYEIDTSDIDSLPFGKDDGRYKYRLGKGPLRFQVPRGKCTWGVSAYKSMQVEITDPQFTKWWKELETLICPQEPFNTNLKNGILRMKIDDATYVFDERSRQIEPEIQEGLFKGQDVSCLIDIESNYFFKGSWGLTVRVYQIKHYGGGEPEPEPEPEVPIQKGVCAFLD